MKKKLSNEGTDHNFCGSKMALILENLGIFIA